jgi:hypothetical protein
MSERGDLIRRLYAAALKRPIGEEARCRKRTLPLRSSEAALQREAQRSVKVEDIFRVDHLDP